MICGIAQPAAYYSRPISINASLMELFLFKHFISIENINWRYS